MEGYPCIHIREIRPKDFYYAQVLRSKDASLLPLIYRMIENKAEVDDLPAKAFKRFVKWVLESLLEENILTVENWLEVSFHLCRQRWDSSMDWLEMQPMSKIKAMIDIQERYVEEENDRMKKG